MTTDRDAPITTWPSRDEVRAEGRDPDTGVPYDAALEVVDGIIKNLRGLLEWAEDVNKRLAKLEAATDELSDVVDALAADGRQLLGAYMAHLRSNDAHSVKASE